MNGNFETYVVKLHPNMFKYSILYQKVDLREKHIGA